MAAAFSRSSLGNYFVQSVGGGVVVVEISAAVLHNAEGGDSGIGHGFDVGAGSISGGLKDGRADAVKNGLHGTEGIDGGGGEL